MRRDEGDGCEGAARAKRIEAERVEIARGIELRGYHAPEGWVWLLCLSSAETPLLVRAAGAAVN